MWLRPSRPWFAFCKLSEEYRKNLVLLGFPMEPKGRSHIPMNLFFVFILSFFLTVALVPVLKRMAFSLNLVDVPGPRKVHQLPMPKTGGISMALGAFVPMMVWVSGNAFVDAVILGAAVILVSGIVDDVRPLNPVQKMIPQAVAAIIVIYWGDVRITSLGPLFTDPLPWPVSIPLTLVTIIGITNAINLSDGLDGLAGGISLLSFAMIVFLSHQSGLPDTAVMAVAVVGGIAGFLRYNTHPAMLFMGDAGSQLLGFLSIVFAIGLTQANTPYGKWLFLPLIGFPILDTATVMVERILKKRSPFRADKNHFHHRLMGLGFVHTESVLIIYAVQSVFIAFALVFRFYPGWVHVTGFLGWSLLVLVPFFRARAVGWRLPRPGRPSSGKDGLSTGRPGFRLAVIRISFGMLKAGLPLVLAAQVMIPGQIPVPVSWLALGLILPLGAACCLRLDHVREPILRFSVYLVFPFVLFLAETDPAPWFISTLARVNNLGFFCLVPCMLLTMNLTRRRQGFKITPMDILIIIVVLILPNLPSMPFSDVLARAVIAKALVICYGLDIVIRELRGEYGYMAAAAMVLMASLALRGFFGV